MKKILNDIKGNVLGIGINEEILKILKDNKKVLELNVLDNQSISKKNNKEKSKKNKKIDIKNIKKHFKKVDYIFCDYTILNKHFNRFVDDSVSICEKEIYFTNYDDSKITTRFKMYDVNIKTIEQFLVVNVMNKKSRKGLKYIDMFKFKVSLIIEFIGDVLMS